MNGTRLSTFDRLRNMVCARTGAPLSFGQTLMLGATRHVALVCDACIAGAGTGMMSGFLASPFMLVKTHLQAMCHSEAAVGFQV